MNGITPALPGRVNLPGIAAILLVVLAWEIYRRTWGAGLETLASTVEIAKALVTLVRDGPLIGQLAHTFAVSVIGWLAACLVGFAIGLAVGLWRPVWTYTMASIDVLRSIPSIALVSIALILFGFSPKMEIIMVIYVSQWPVLLATASGAHSVPASYLDTARAMRLTRGATIRKIVLPAALPGIVVSLRLALTLAIALAVVAEMIGNPEGLGFGLVFSQQAIQPAKAFAYLLVIGLLGWGANYALASAVRRTLRNYGTLL